MNRDPSYHQLLPFVVLYFTANNFLLPHGLLFTTLLTPVFLYWLFKTDGLVVFLKWTLLLLLPIPFHLFTGFEIRSYIVSTILVFSAWVFLFTALKAVARLDEDIEGAFRVVLIVNSILLAAALLILPFAPVRDLMWYSIPISPNIPGFPRLKLLAYESSHYALLLSPVLLYFLLRVALRQANHSFLLLVAVFLPLGLSLSFGVLAALLIALFAGSLVVWRRLPKYYFRFSFYVALGLVLLTIVVFLIWPENPVFTRLDNIFTGSDTSAKGRLYDSFRFATDLIRGGYLLMGIGPGQIKVLAHDLIINYYRYSGEFAEIVRIPNSMAEMLATYGVYGFMLKLFFEIYFFIRLRIYRNFYTLILFLFLFLYQFTGSFIVNAAELGGWAIVYRGRLARFDLFKLKDFEG